MSWKAVTVRPKVAMARPSEFARPEPNRRKSMPPRRAINKEEHERRINAATYRLREAYAKFSDVAGHQVTEWQCLLSSFDCFTGTIAPFDSCLIRLKERFVQDNRLRHREVEFVLPKISLPGTLYSIKDLRIAIASQAKLWQELYVKAYEFKWLVEEAAFTSGIFKLSSLKLEKEISVALEKNLAIF